MAALRSTTRFRWLAMAGLKTRMANSVRCVYKTEQLMQGPSHWPKMPALAPIHQPVLCRASSVVTRLLNLTQARVGPSPSQARIPTPAPLPSARALYKWATAAAPALWAQARSRSATTPTCATCARQQRTSSTPSQARATCRPRSRAAAAT